MAYMEGGRRKGTGERKTGHSIVIFLDKHYSAGRRRIEAIAGLILLASSALLSLTFTFTFVQITPKWIGRSVGGHNIHCWRFFFFLTGFAFHKGFFSGEAIVRAGIERAGLERLNKR